MPTLYDVPLTTLAGAPTTLQPYRGSVLLLVNVASRCGLTKQYTALDELYRQYKDRGLVVLGFPANNFADQEPGTDQEIAKFCSIDYPVSFPLFSKISVVGPDIHPLYRQLTAAAPEQVVNGVGFRGGITAYLATQGLPAPEPLPAVLWNFEKFVVGRNGDVVARFAPDTPPNDPRVVAVIESALNEASPGL